MKTPRKILVVDDEKTILLSLAYALKGDGVDVITCNRAEWAEKALENYFFDIVITDLRLSKTGDAEGMRIVELTKTRHPTTKVILITAYGSEEVCAEARRLGADEYFDKPMDLNLLLKTIERFGVPVGKRGSAAPAPQAGS